MKILIVLLLALISFNCNSATTPIKDQEKLIEMSEKILNHLQAEEFEKVRADFNTQAKDGLTPSMLKNVWNGLVSQIGEYEEKGNILTEMQEGYRVVYIICKFEKQPFKLKVVFDDQDLVTALLLIPVNQR